MASVAVVVFTRDLRVDDHPARPRGPRGGAGGAPLRVRRHDPRQLLQPAQPHRVSRGVARRPRRRAPRSAGALVVRRGEWVREVAAVVDEVGAGLGARERRRERVRPRAVGAPRRPVPVPIERAPGITVVAPGEITPGSGRVAGLTTTKCSRRTSAAGPKCAVATWSTRRTTSRCPTASTRAPCRSSTSWSTATAPRTSRRGAPAPGTPSSRRGSSRGCAATPTTTTTCPAMPRRASRRTSTSGASHHWRRSAHAGHHQGEGRCVRAAALLARLLPRRFSPTGPTPRRRLHRPRRPLA